MSVLARIRRRLAPLVRDQSGLALIEFAYVMPVMMTLGLGGVEVANYSIINMRVSQIAVSLADNASRAKEEIINGVPHMREYDVNETFAAAAVQSGSLDIEQNGRLILSSLETNGDGGQWIHWQRCSGEGDFQSSYGVEGDGETGTNFPGMGPDGEEITAEADFAIMFAEVVYDFKPLLFDRFVSAQPIRKTAAMYVRDDRDLTQIYNPSPAAPVSTCD